jgi:hypothetical protein
MFWTYLVILVDFVHSSFAFLLGDDLARILHDDLVRLEAAIAADAVAAVGRLDDLDSHAVLAAPGSPGCQVGKGSIRAARLADVAVCVVALVEHDSVLARLAAAVLWLAYTLGLIIEDVRHLFPDFLGLANEPI